MEDGLEAVPRPSRLDNITGSNDSPPALIQKVTLEVDNKRFEHDCLIDTGATGIFLSMEVARQLYGPSFPTEGTRSSACRVANGELITTYIGPPTKFTIMGKSIIECPYITMSLSYNIIIGYRNVGQFGFIIDPVYHTLRVCTGPPQPGINSIQAMASTQSIIQQHEEVGIAQLQESITLEPNVVTPAQILLKQASDINDFIMLTPNAQSNLPKGVLPAYQLAVSENSHSVAWLCNTTAGKIQLARGTVVASASIISQMELPKLSAVSVQDRPTSISKSEFFGKFSWPDLSQEETSRLQDFIWERRHVFSLSSTDLGCFKQIKHDIDTGNNRPVRQALRRHNPNTREEIKRQVGEMLEAGIIRPSTSPWASPPVMVRKKDGTMRFAIDFRVLNARTVKDSFPLPRIMDALDCLGNSKYYTTLDLTSGYWQMELEEEAKPKTAFSTHMGLFEFNKMAYGLTNAPASFQRAMQCCLAGLNWDIALCFLDDVIIFSKDFDEHLSRLGKVLDRFQQFHLKLKPSKCHLLQEEVSYLGHRVSAAGISTDPQKIQAVREWPTPTNCKDVKSFLGLCLYYRRFVHRFSDIATPLYDVSNLKRFQWTAEAQAAFVKLKEALITAPVLGHPDFSLPFIVDADASDLGVGCTLSQIQQGKERPIAYTSKKFDQQEKRWPITEQESYAAVLGVRVFRSYLLGRKFTLRTDHQALTFMQSKTQAPSGKIARWMMELQQYDFDMVYRPGIRHRNADALSRNPHLPPDSPLVPADPEVCAPVFTTPLPTLPLHDFQSNDPEISSIIRHLVAKRKGPLPKPVRSHHSPIIRHFQLHHEEYSMQDGLLMFSQKVVVPSAALPQLLHLYHDIPLSGHLGRNRISFKLNERYFWPSMASDIKSYIESCIACGARKVDANKPWAPLQPSAPTIFPFQRIAMDILTLPSCRGYSKVLVVVDYFSKWPEAFPIRNNTAKTVAEVLFKEIYCRWATPSYLHSDLGAEFTSSLLHTLSKILGIKQTHTLAYTPKADGQVERQIRTISDMLSKYAQSDKDWMAYLDPCLHALRTSQHESVGFSPYEIMFGRKPSLMPDLEFGLPVAKETRHPETFNQLRDRLHEVHADVKRRLAAVAERMKKQYEARRRIGTDRFGMGDWIWVRRPQGPAPKLNAKFDGPFLVQDITWTGGVVIDRYGFEDTVGPDRCKLFTKRPAHLAGPEYEQAFQKAKVTYQQNPPEFVLPSFSTPPPPMIHSAPPPPSIPAPAPSIPAPSIPAPSVPTPSQQDPTHAVPAIPPSPESSPPPIVAEPRPTQVSEAVEEEITPPAIEAETTQPAAEREPTQVRNHCSSEDIQRIINNQPRVVLQRLPQQSVTAPASNRPTRLLKPRQRLTYDDNFKQVASIQSCHSLNLPDPIFTLGIKPQNTEQGVVVTFTDQAFAKTFCSAGDRIVAINNTPIRTAMDYLTQLSMAPAQFSITLQRPVRLSSALCTEV